jgi:hypothetical protein
MLGDDLVVSNRQYLLDQLSILDEDEEKIQLDLQRQLSMLAGGEVPAGMTYTDLTGFDPSSSSSTSINLLGDLKKIEQFAPSFENVMHNCSKLTAQVEDCCNLSERLNRIVRQLDLKQMRAQKALACTEDILNIKDCKFRISAAIEAKNLSEAVSYIRQVHEIDEKAAKTSDDFDIVVEKEAEVKEMVRSEFQAAITATDVDAVMALCPLLHTLGLETEARDNFLSFMEEKVFIAVSADAAAVEGTTDAATAYAQALSGVFNSTYLIIQQYLPMVIQGLESSLGDVYFLRKLHKRCEQEAGSVLKRYMKFRALKEIVASIKTNSVQVTHAEVHVIMDELALLIQYCCKYLKYFRHVCQGAETKVRGKRVEHAGDVVVFAGPQEFDRMIEELTAKYYLEGEQWLMRQGVVNTFPRVVEDGTKLDECFFVLQKCGLRAIATNNIQASCAVLNFVADMISSDLQQQALQMVDYSVSRVLGSLQEHIARYRKSLNVSDAGLNSSGESNKTTSALSKGFTNAFSLASTLAGGVSNNVSNEVVNSVVVFHPEGGFTLPGVGSPIDNPWGTMAQLEVFNVIELCIRYIDRLNRDLIGAGQIVFDSEDSNSNNKVDISSKQKKNVASSSKPAKSTLNASASLVTSDMDRLRVCKDNFDGARVLFNNVSVTYNMLWLPADDVLFPVRCYVKEPTRS